MQETDGEFLGEFLIRYFIYWGLFDNFIPHNIKVYVRACKNTRKY